MPATPNFAPASLNMPKMSLPTGYEAQQREIALKEKIAQALMAQGIKPDEHMTSWAQVVGQLAQAWAGKHLEKKVTEKTSELNSRMMQDYQTKYGALAAALQDPEFQKNPTGALTQFGGDPMLQDSPLLSVIKSAATAQAEGNGKFKVEKPGDYMNRGLIQGPDGKWYVNDAWVTAHRAAAGGDITGYPTSILDPKTAATPPTSGLPTAAPSIPQTPVPGQSQGAAPAGNLFSYKDPGYDMIESQVEKQLGLPFGLLRSVRVNGERSNANQVSPAGARTVYQIIPGTRDGIKQNYGVDPYTSPQNAVMGAGLVLKENLKRTGGDVAGALRQYIGGLNPSNYGPQTQAYVTRTATPNLANPGSRPPDGQTQDGHPVWKINGQFYDNPEGR